jgi:hypothetical protein
MNDTMRIEMVALSMLERWPRNPKGHAADLLDSSIGRFGYVAPILVDEGTGKIVAGHGRLESLSRRKAAGEPPPKRVVVGQNGDWMVPVIRGVEFANEHEAEAYLLADNRLSEVGGWDDNMLVSILSDWGGDSLIGLGWELTDITDMITEVQLDSMKTPAIQISEDNKGYEPREGKFWVWADCEGMGQMEELISRFGCGKGRQLDAAKILAIIPIKD